MRKGEGQDLARRWTSSGECNFAATKRRLWRPRYTKCAHCRYVHISRPIPRNAFYRGDPPLTAGSGALCPRDLTWSSSLPSAAICLSAEIFHERKIPGGPEKRRTLWGMRFSMEHLPTKHFKLYRRVYACVYEKCTLIYLKKIKQSLSKLLHLILFIEIKKDIAEIRT